MTRPALTHDVRIIDTTLRDGSHAMGHRFTEDQVRSTVRALDRAGVEWIEVSHGDGVGGSSFNYGFSGTDEMDLIAAAAEEAGRARIAVLLVPGIGTADDLRRAHAAGARMVRVATHCTEADISPQYFEVARELGMETCGFLMMAHRAEPKVLAEQARIMVDAGCQSVYVTDSAGALLMHEARERFEALVAEVGDQAWVGYHGHQNMSLGVANSVLGQQAGVRYFDGSLCALGAGSGNSPTEVLGAVFDRLGVRTGLDVASLLDAAEDVVRPYLPRWPKMDRNAIVQGWAGVYSSFLLHAERAAARYGVPAQDILRRCGELGYVGGQEDMIIDVAVQLAAEEEGTAPVDEREKEAVR
ncbi:4-hydroxy-2-oxovalerate aldolase [Nocardiopsis sp. HNM0947]|uniref:4-hydroxy-2-oxovalerate aldolase n=1 Tax=Nocardiopsis coralli TaxID=2772213 RepID=A0ABR9P188_9ACTN|nr:4-hydroxy-2-oxovalerate aldolase [Nocardiopsis coralli]MBE2997530.1 4-hydroxy-2-oxovalerate aldolase [Nocardiopsis coralli]